jgi:hypothetical protein
MDPNPIRYHPSFLEENPTLLVWILLGGIYFALFAIGKYAWYIRNDQLLEFTLWFLLFAVATFLGVYQFTRAKRAREEAWPKQLPTIPTRGERDLVERAWGERSVVLGYDVHGKPWKWADETRVMQALVLGQTGSGKTTLLRNIISQDLMRRSAHRTPPIRSRW